PCPPRAARAKRERAVRRGPAGGPARARGCGSGRRAAATASRCGRARARPALAERGAEPLAAEPPPDPVTLSPAILPGGLGAHKWRDRRLLDELAQRVGAVPLIVDLDGDVLEAAASNLFVVEGN